jgi:cytochrome c peroxidase
MSWKVGILLVAGICLCSFLVNAPNNNNEKVNAIFGAYMEEAISSIDGFEKAIDNKAGKKILIKRFKEARLSYKKAAVLIDYFHPAETKLLNGAALPRTEEDNPITVYQPHGFQVIEEIIYGDKDDSFYIKLSDEVKRIATIYRQLKNQPDRAYKFKDPIVLNALQAAMIRLISLGISGFDSPVANYSIPEAQATIEGIEDLYEVYESSTATKELFRSAVAYLDDHTNFNRFDRLEFISGYAQPLYSALIELGNKGEFQMPPGLRPVNNTVANPFTPAFFDIAFFAPQGRFAATPERIELGKKLFFDKRLSSTRDRSCASCHDPKLAFTDGVKAALAIDKKNYLQRNTPTLWNSVYQTRQFYDSRATLLEHQLNAVVHSQQEMGGSLAKSVSELSGDAEYRSLFTQAYASEEQPISQHSIANAISTYVRSLVSMNSRFDQYMRGNRMSLSAEERKGFNLFMGKAKCGTCHFLPLFNGLVPPDFSDTESEVLGVPASNTKVNATIDPDEGKFVHSRSPLHKYAFKTPSLRNIALTAPYMHNGVFNTLEEVVDFYSNGGGAGLNIQLPNQTLPPDKLKLSGKESKALVAFLRSLTDSTAAAYAKYNP